MLPLLLMREWTKSLRLQYWYFILMRTVFKELESFFVFPWPRLEKERLDQICYIICGLNLKVSSKLSFMWPLQQVILNLNSPNINLPASLALMPLAIPCRNGNQPGVWHWKQPSFLDVYTFLISHHLFTALIKTERITL